MQQSKVSVAENFFGKITKGQNGPHKVVLSKLLTPFEGDKTVACTFCTNCNNYMEINNHSLEILTNIASISKSSDMRGRYIETKKCGVCNSTPEGVKFKNIPN